MCSILNVGRANHMGLRCCLFIPAHTGRASCVQIPSGQTYKSPGEAYVEGDASSASYFLAGATITGGTITVEGCGSDSLQGDVRFAEVMGLLGAKVWRRNVPRRALLCNGVPPS